MSISSIEFNSVTIIWLMNVKKKKQTEIKLMLSCERNKWVKKPKGIINIWNCH